jgi:signal transduction histidine kinase
VFQNIIHNAVQAMSLGGRLIVSAGGYREKTGCVAIAVSDTGGGIAPEEVEKIFHPFYTTKDSGTGLGLSLAHRIVEAHKGKIWVCHNPCSSSPISGKRGPSQFVPPEKGVTFHIVLPSNDRPKRNSHNKVMK